MLVKDKIDEIIDNSNETLFSVFVSDLDLSSAYPTNTVAYNVSRSTCKHVVTEIIDFTRDDIEEYFSCLSAKKENVMFLCEKYFGLPNYSELDELFKKL